MEKKNGFVLFLIGELIVFVVLYFYISSSWMRTLAIVFILLSFFMMFYIRPRYE